MFSNDGDDQMIEYKYFILRISMKQLVNTFSSRLRRIISLNCRYSNESIWEKPQHKNTEISKCDVLIEKGLIDFEKNIEAFVKFTLVSFYVPVKKVKEWNFDYLNEYSKHRWRQVFQHFFSMFSVCLVRMNSKEFFLLMTNLWTSENSQLQESV